jgi:hypothetical protein
MPKLADAIAAEATRKGPACHTSRILEKLSKADAADLRGALADVMIPATAISRALDKLGHQLSATSLARHRRGECGCPR